MLDLLSIFAIWYNNITLGIASKRHAYLSKRHIYLSSIFAIWYSNISLEIVLKWYTITKNYILRQYSYYSCSEQHVVLYCWFFNFIRHATVLQSRVPYGFVRISIKVKSIRLLEKRNLSASQHLISWFWNSSSAGFEIFFVRNFFN